ncbi:MAG: hypothetical protein V4652_13955 [Bacteroidota bacterium]|jgi:hypothetical protein
MNPKIILIIIFLICFSCKNDNSQDEIIIYTHTELHYNYSMKLNSSDTIFYDFRGKDSGLFYSIINPNDKKIFNTILNKIDFKNDTTYEQNNLFDGKSFQFYKIKNNKPKRVFIYGDNAPKEYYRFATILNNLMNKQKKYKLKSDKDWAELKFMIPPPPPSPEVYNNNR